MESNLQTASQGRNLQQRDGQAANEPFVVPPVDVFEDEGGITLLADLPGVPRDQLGIRVDGDTLTIEGKANAASPEGMQLVYGEAQVSNYRRQFSLSRELDASRIDAQLKDGVLRLTVPKSEEARPRRIEVKVA